MHLNSNLSKNILTWYDNNKRDLPWRVGKKSKKKLYYRVLSEFMLQQTKVKTVIPYFEKFTEKFPDLKSLSKCKEHQILKSWEGLGYYRRAKNLLATVKILVIKKKSILPKTIEEIKKLPGVGDYTANALLGLVYERPTLAVDGNVKRIFSRILDKREEDINFQNLIESNKKKLFNTGRNADFLEAIMEFGALICKPKLPNCSVCKIRNFCSSNKIKKVFANKNKKKTTVKYYDIFCYLNKKKKQIALTKKNKVSFLEKFFLPDIKKSSTKKIDKKWKLLNQYNNSISNKKLKINLYYKFSKKLPPKFSWHSIKNNKEFIPTFTKQIFKKVSGLY